MWSYLMVQQNVTLYGPNFTSLSEFSLNLSNLQIWDFPDGKSQYVTCAHSVPDALISVSMKNTSLHLPKKSEIYSKHP